MISRVSGWRNVGLFIPDGGGITSLPYVRVLPPLPLWGFQFLDVIGIIPRERVPSGLERYAVGTSTDSEIFFAVLSLGRSIPPYNGNEVELKYGYPKNESSITVTKHVVTHLNDPQ